jgi:hypothetical protein
MALQAFFVRYFTLRSLDSTSDLAEPAGRVGFQSSGSDGALKDRYRRDGVRPGSDVRQEEFYFRARRRLARPPPLVPSALDAGADARGRRDADGPEARRCVRGPEQLRQVFNDTDAETLWLIFGAPEELEWPPDEVH